MFCILAIYTSTVLRTLLSENTGLFVSSREHQGMCGHHLPLQGVYVYFSCLQTLWFRRLLESTPSLFLMLTSLPLEGRSVAVAPALRWWFPAGAAGAILDTAPAKALGMEQPMATCRAGPGARAPTCGNSRLLAWVPNGEQEGPVLSPCRAAMSPGWAVQELVLEPWS